MKPKPEINFFKYIRNTPRGRDVNNFRTLYMRLGVCVKNDSCILCTEFKNGLKEHSTKYVLGRKSDLPFDNCHPPSQLVLNLRF